MDRTPIQETEAPLEHRCVLFDSLFSSPLLSPSKLERNNDRLCNFLNFSFFTSLSKLLKNYLFPFHFLSFPSTRTTKRSKIFEVRIVKFYQSSFGDISARYSFSPTKSLKRDEREIEGIVRVEFRISWEWSWSWGKILLKIERDLGKERKGKE